MNPTPRLALVAASLVLVAGSILLRSQTAVQPAPPPPTTIAIKVTDELAALRAEVERLKGLVPDQAHAMQDVGYHFANLWFAAGRKHWPLADFYLAETRSHLRWAVRIRPTRQTRAGDVDLKGILDALDNTSLAAVKTAIEHKDAAAFTNAYRQTIDGCYACHKASEKPFIRPQVPTAPAEHLINLDAEARWPQ